MSATSDLERRVRVVLDAGAPSAPPAELLARVLSTTSRSRPRPAWLADLKEPPMRHSARVTVGSPTLRLAAILALTVALALVAAGAVVAGASILPSPPVQVPPPFGPADNGSLLYAQDGDIYLADADGSNQRAIITGDTNDWSPWFSHDGRSIVFARGQEPNIALMHADADGPNVREILPPQEWNAEFMADDSTMVVTRTVGDGTVLSMVDLATGSVRDLDLEGAESWYWQEPRPNSDEIVFLGHTTPGGPERGLFAVRPDGSGLRIIGAVTTGETREDDTRLIQRSFQDVDLSPDGRTIAYWSWEPKGGITGAPSDAFLHLRDADTGEDVPVLFDQLGDRNPKGDDYGSMPRFSPDGTMIVFDGCDSGGLNGLCYGPVDGSSPAHPIGPSYDYTVRNGFELSPDGTKVILFLTDHSTVIDLASNTWTDLDIAGDWVSWQRLAQS